MATVGEDGTVNALTEGTTIITVKGKSFRSINNM